MLMKTDEIFLSLHLQPFLPLLSDLTRHSLLKSFFAFRCLGFFPSLAMRGLFLSPCRGICHRLHVALCVNSPHCGEVTHWSVCPVTLNPHMMAEWQVWEGGWWMGEESKALFQTDDIYWLGLVKSRAPFHTEIWIVSLKETYSVKNTSSCSWEQISGRLKSPAGVKLPKTQPWYLFSSPLFESSSFNEPLWFSFLKYVTP